MEKKILNNNNKDVIIGSISLVGLILLIISMINFQFVFILMKITSFLKLNPFYNLGPSGGYGIAFSILFYLPILILIGLIIVTIIFFLRKKYNRKENYLIKFSFLLYFFITFLIQIYSIYGAYLSLVKEPFNVIKTINFIISYFIIFSTYYIPAITMLLIYLIIKSINKIRNKGIKNDN